MPPDEKLVIAIDGPSASGKSTTAQAVALRLGYLYVDTGAMYRALALKSMRENLPANDPAALGRFLEHTSVDCAGTGGVFRVTVDGLDVTDDIRAADVSSKASEIAALPAVRRWMVAKQQEISRRPGGVVMEGRDIGTVVLSDADLKIYLDASEEQRVVRRWKEERARGERSSRAQVKRQIEERDFRDMTRAHSPLERAADAIRIDTTELTIEEQVERVLEEVRRVLRDRKERQARADGQGK